MKLNFFYSCSWAYQKNSNTRLLWFQLNLMLQLCDRFVILSSSCSWRTQDGWPQMFRRLVRHSLASPFPLLHLRKTEACYTLPNANQHHKCIRTQSSSVVFRDSKLLSAFLFQRLGFATFASTSEQGTPLWRAYHRSPVLNAQ